MSINKKSKYQTNLERVANIAMQIAGKYDIIFVMLKL